MLQYKNQTIYQQNYAADDPHAFVSFKLFTFADQHILLVIQYNTTKIDLLAFKYLNKTKERVNITQYISV